MLLDRKTQYNEDVHSLKKCIYKTNASPIKLPTGFFMELSKLTCVCVCVFIFKEQRIMLLKKNKVGQGGTNP